MRGDLSRVADGFSCMRCDGTIQEADLAEGLIMDGLKFKRAEMPMIRWMCGISMKDRRTNDELRRRVGLELITTVIRRSGRLG